MSYTPPGFGIGNTKTLRLGNLDRQAYIRSIQDILHAAEAPQTYSKGEPFLDISSSKADGAVMHICYISETMWNTGWNRSVAHFKD